MDFVYLTSCLSQKGFKFFFDLKKEEKFNLYKGQIQTTTKGLVSIILYFSKSIDDFPLATIADESKALYEPFHNPHIGKDWDICYKDNSVVFDTENLQNSVSFIISQISSVLNDYKKDDMSEILQEWKSYWDPDETVYTYISLDTNSLLRNGKFLYHGNNCLDSISIMQINKIPSIENCQWPIENFEELRKWLSDSEMSKQIEKEIKYNLRFLIGKKQFIFYCKEFNLAFGISFLFTDPLLNNKKQHQLTKNSIESLFLKNKVSRFWVDRVGNEILLSSNVKTDFISLKNKKVAVIGAGTVGSNLLQILTRNGAGSTKENQIAIIDYDRFEPENYTRHTLPFEYFGKNKAESLKQELIRSNPLINVESFSKSVFGYCLQQYDIILDVTGEDVVTYKLCAEFSEKTPDSILIVGWVNVDGKNVSCIIVPPHGNIDLKEIHNIFSSKNNDVSSLPRRNSCSSVYVPFPIMLSQYAALLVTRGIWDCLEQKVNKTTLYSQNIETFQMIKKDL